MTFRALCLAPVLTMLAAAPALAGGVVLVVGEPGPRAVVATPPHVLVLSFSAPLQVAFCQITVTNPEGNPVPVARPQAVLGQPDELVVPVEITQAGRYIVTWQVSASTHQHGNGRYIFTVQ